MAAIDRNKTVREVLETHPELRPVFEALALNTSSPPTSPSWSRSSPSYCWVWRYRLP